MKKPTVLITGGSSGIGYETAKLLNEHNFRVYSLDLNLPKEKVSGITYLRANVTSSNEIQSAIKTIKGKLDILINNAGIMHRGTLLGSSEEDFDALIAVNIKGPWLILKHTQPLLTKDATLIQISSRHAITLPINPALYALTKMALVDLSRLLGAAYPDYKVKLAFLGPVDTPLSRTGKTNKALKELKLHGSKPKDIAALLLRFISSTKSKLLYDGRTHTYSFA